MKRILTLALVLAVLGWAVAAQAVIGTIDEVPAATLLLPYFEVDLNDPNGVTTLLSINNASATAVLAHVVIWSDSSVHVLDFNVYLTGYDVQTINLRDIIVNGNLPQTADAVDDPGDKISPKGPKSQDITFPNCTGILPINPLPASFISHLRNSLTGQPSAIFGGKCAGGFHANAIGYITVDTVNACTLLSPGDSGYFGPSGVATDQNVLWGDFFIVSPRGNAAYGGPLVHIEASPTNPKTTTSGAYTFYGRYNNPPFTAVDHREALPTTFVTRYFFGGTRANNTNLLVWRDSKTNQGPFTCFAGPSWFPLGQEGIVVFDEQEQPSVPPPCSVSPCVDQKFFPFPFETQQTAITSSALAVPFNSGWLYLDLNTTVTGASGLPPLDPAAAQAWVIAAYFSGGQFSVGVNGIQLDNAFAAQHFVP
jgi:hypothetical protein